MRRFLKTFIVMLVATFMILSIRNTVSATDLTPTTTITTEPSTTTTDTTLPNLVNDESILDTLAPKLQIGMQIGQAIFIIISAIVIFKQRIETAVAKKREQDAKTELSVEKASRSMLLQVMGTTMTVLNMIAQNSKLPTADKLSINEMILNDKTAMAQLNETVAQITGLNSTDISGIIGSLEDIFKVASGGLSAIKTGDITKLTKAVTNTDKEGD